MASRSDAIKAARARVRVTMPGLTETVGVGDLVHKVTQKLGIHHCSECERRKAALNRLFAFETALKKDE